jgi:hypothetical protein
MADVFAIIRFDISQGDASGYEIETFSDLDEARRAFDAGRASGAYVDEGSFWSGATAYELVQRSAQGYFALDGGKEVGPNGLLGPPTIRSAEVGGTWSVDPTRRVGWPG